MKVSDLVSQFGLTVFSGELTPDREISGVYVSDLLSDVMGNAMENQAWITLQTHQNVLAVASLKDLAAVILVKGLRPDPETAERSNTEGIPVLGSPLETFELAGKLYNAWMNDLSRGG